ncbi:hypothetical protein HDU97_006873 [Phlyctochytrium planicorne]|nr:hypothetical protein HDU97_006873 [Phlyctochytrium planicorne]
MATNGTPSSTASAPYVNLNKDFVRRVGSTLVVPSPSDATKFYRFRFVSLNVPNLHWNEDISPQDTPTAWEQADATRSLAMMGCRVTRTYVLSIVPNGWNTTTGSSAGFQESVESSASIASTSPGNAARVKSTTTSTKVIVTSTSTTSPVISTSTTPLSTASNIPTPPRRHIANLDPSTLSSIPTNLRPPGSWKLVPGTANHRIKLSINEDLFVALDMAIAQAGVHGIRIILPFIDHWQWWGGVQEFTTYYGKPKNSFYTDDEVIKGFEALVQYVVQRVNTVTGVKYKDDPSILAWETGNELGGYDNYKIPSAWTGRIARTIKAVDPNHLVADGAFQVNGWEDAVLADQMVDLHSGHYYQLPANFNAIIMAVGFFSASVAVLAALGFTAWPYVKNKKWPWKKGRALESSEPQTSDSETFIMNSGRDSLDNSERGLSDGATIVSASNAAAAVTSTSLLSGREPKSFGAVGDANAIPLTTAGISGSTPVTPPIKSIALSKLSNYIRPTVIVVLLIILVATVTVTAIKGREATKSLWLTIADRFGDDVTRVIATYQKPYFVGEFGLDSIDTLINFVDRVAALSSGACGIMAWSLRFRSSKGGFYTHSEGSPYWSYHYPGFPSQPITGSGALYPRSNLNGESGFNQDEISFVRAIQDRAIVAYQTDYLAPLPNSFFVSQNLSPPTVIRPNVTSTSSATDLNNPFLKSRPSPAPVILPLVLLGGTAPPVGWPASNFPGSVSGLSTTLGSSTSTTVRTTSSGITTVGITSSGITSAGITSASSSSAGSSSVGSVSRSSTPSGPITGDIPTLPATREKTTSSLFAGNTEGIPTLPATKEKATSSFFSGSTAAGPITDEIPTLPTTKERATSSFFSSRIVSAALFDGNLISADATLSAAPTVWLSWTGSTGASRYILEVSNAGKDGPFTMLSDNVLDNVIYGDGIVQLQIAAGSAIVPVQIVPVAEPDLASTSTDSSAKSNGTSTSTTKAIATASVSMAQGQAPALDGQVESAAVNGFAPPKIEVGSKPGILLVTLSLPAWIRVTGVGEFGNSDPSEVVMIGA